MQSDALKGIRKWSGDKLVARAGALGKILASNPEDSSHIDELIIVYLEILRLVVKEKGWEDSPLDLFVGVYGSMRHPASVKIFERFFDTQDLLLRFKSSPSSVRNLLRPRLVQRGLL